MNKIKHIVRSISSAEIGISKLNDSVLSIPGSTGIKIKHLLNNIVNFENSNYLEIGLNQGATLTAALFGNNLNRAYGIEVSEVYIKQILSYKKIFNISFEFLNEDCFRLDLSRIKNKINVYLYDGEHTYEDQYRALEYYYSVLDDEFIFMVDDWLNEEDRSYHKWKQVPETTRTSIKNLNLKILFEQHKERSKKDFQQNAWWGGFWISLLKK